MTASADDSLLPLDSPGSVVVFIPGDQEYDEMMEKINDDDSVCSSD